MEWNIALQKLMTSKVTSVALLGLALYSTYSVVTGIAGKECREGVGEEHRWDATLREPWIVLA